MRLLKCISLLLANAEAMRVARSDKGAVRSDTDTNTSYTFGRVYELYTWGAPRVSSKPLRNYQASNGCFSGRRLVNIDASRNMVDSVPTIPMWYQHPLIAMSKVDEDNQLRETNRCGWTGSEVEIPSVSLHMADKYTDRMTGSGSTVPTGYKTITQVGLKPSYMNGTGEIKDFISGTGYDLVGTTAVNKKETHLFQNNNKDCILTFQGTDATGRPQDVIDDVNTGARDFCKLPDCCHGGFVRQMRMVTEDSGFQNQIKAKLPKCRRVTVAGHSLGGALASLFAACVSQDHGSEDYRNMRWQPANPERMSRL